MAASISHFVTAATKFSCCSSNKNMSPLFFISRSKKQFPLSVFVFIDCFVISALQDAGGYAISSQNILELHLGCHTCWLSYFTLVCLWCGQTVSRCTVMWLPNFLGWVHYFIFLPMVLPWCASRARAPLKKERFNKIWITWLNSLNCLNIFAEYYIL